MIAELLCAWFAGVVLGWRISRVQRRIHAETHHWAIADGRPPFNWAEEPER